jgi:hypothetical protein
MQEEEINEVLQITFEDASGEDRADVDSPADVVVVEYLSDPDPDDVDQDSAPPDAHRHR